MSKKRDEIIALDAESQRLLGSTILACGFNPARVTGGQLKISAAFVRQEIRDMRRILWGISHPNSRRGRGLDGHSCRTSLPAEPLWGTADLSQRARSGFAPTFTDDPTPV